MDRKILTLTLLMAVAPGAAMSASVYKWTDENGVIHFGDQQPNGKQAEIVSVRAGTAKPTDSSRQSPQERLNSLEEQQAEKQEQEKAAQASEAQRKQRAKNCEAAKKNLDIIRNKSRIRVDDGEEQRYLTPEEIEQYKVKYEEAISEFCGPEAPADQ